MKIKSASDVFELLGACVPSTALGLALELGLFWKLEKHPHTASQLSTDLNIPLNRCRYWLDILVRMELLEREDHTYSLSETASDAVLSIISQDAWQNMALQSRDAYPCLINLPEYIHEPRNALAAQGVERKNYFQHLKEDPERARQFTHMLFEFHQSLAGNLAEAVSMDGVERLMDLGGGSGIMSHAILARNPKVFSTIVDIENVCRAGREIAGGFSTADRINHHPADFITDDLPKGFDMVLECDVCVYKPELFDKLRGCLNPDGRLVIVDQFAPESGVVPPGRPLAWGFIGSLEDPNYTFPTSEEVTELLAETGFRILSETPLPGHWLMIDAAHTGLT